MDVMLLAAGRSTRLGALGLALPKPLVPVCGYPAIRFGLQACRRAGLTDVVINLHHHGEMIRQTLGDGGALGLRIRYSEEPELLGTGGGIRNARPLFKGGPLLVMNAKVVADLDLAPVVAAHRASGALATMVLRPDPEPRRWGAITVDSTGRVTGILDVDSPLTVVPPLDELMFTGIHIIEPVLLDRLPAGVSDIIRDAYIPALREGGLIRSVRLEGYFAEHSTPERYLEGNLALVRQPGLVPHAPGALDGVDPGAIVEPGARLTTPLRIDAGAVVEAGAWVGPDVVLCAQARVTAGTVIQRAVVWGGAAADGKIEDAIVTPDGLVACP